MRELPTAILRHATRAGAHHDWLLADPAAEATGAPDARLWTARLGPPPAAWAQVRRFTLTPLPPHRRVYLTYQGPVAGDRGVVRRVDQGVAVPRLWSATRIVLDLRLTACVGRCELTRLAPHPPHRWLARFTPA